MLTLRELKQLERVFQGGGREIGKDEFMSEVGRVVAKTTDRAKLMWIFEQVGSRRRGPARRATLAAQHQQRSSPRNQIAVRPAAGSTTRAHRTPPLRPCAPAALASIGVRADGHRALAWPPPGCPPRYPPAGHERRFVAAGAIPWRTTDHFEPARHHTPTIRTCMRTLSVWCCVLWCVALLLSLSLSLCVQWEEVINAAHAANR